jgi:hypothetical protein
MNLVSAACMPAGHKIFIGSEVEQEDEDTGRSEAVVIDVLLGESHNQVPTKFQFLTMVFENFK